MKIWLPAVRTRSGADVFTIRLAQALQSVGCSPNITWIPHVYELCPRFARLQPPAGTQVIHANSWTAAAFLKYGLPIVNTVHHLVHDPAYATSRNPAQGLYHQAVIRSRELEGISRSATVTAPSYYVAKTVTAFSRRGDVDVIPNWVDLTQFSPRSEHQRGGPFRVLIVGNASKRKGSDLLPTLASMLGDEVELSCTSGLRGAAKTVAGSVRRLGQLSLSELVHEYRRCDVVVSLSRYEGFGYTALEAMACAKPFLGFRTSGLTEVVEADAGCLVAVEDIAALAAAILKLKGSPVEREIMGRRGRAIAEAKYSESNVMQYVEVYRRALQRFDSAQAVAQ